MTQKRLSILALCSCCLLLGAGATFLVEKVSFTRTNPTALPSVQQVPVLSKGPWGILDELPIPLGNQVDLFVDRPERLRPANWFFEHYTKGKLEKLLNSCNLTKAQWALLQKTNVVTIAPNGIMLAPPDEFVWSLNPFARGKLYEALGEFAANYTQNSPFCFAPGRFRERMAATGLPPDQQTRISSLLYTNNGVLCFSDLQLLPGILNSNELDQVSEALYRVPAYRLRLRVYPDSDIEALVSYWGHSGREKFIRPMLESLAKVPNRTNGTSVNISFLLPPTARLRLFTYPNAWAGSEAERQDCFWTALNFFHNPPDPKYLDGRRSEESLELEYQPISTGPAFGDLIVLLGKNGNGIHACVYVADDFVFTKNGINKLQPWVLMKMSDMLAVFSMEKPARVVTYRKKESSAK